MTNIEHQKLLMKARSLGHFITPKLSAELLILSHVSDERIQETYEYCVNKRLANKFKVPLAAMENRTRGIITKITKVKR